MTSRLRETAESMNELGGTRATARHPWWAVADALLAVMEEYPEAAELAETTYNKRTKEK